MIVRIMSERQYRLADNLIEEMNELDNRIVPAVERGDEAEFRRLFSELLAFVRQRGNALPPEELVQSDVILPPPDTTLEEATRLFAGEGAVPG